MWRGFGQVLSEAVNWAVSTQISLILLGKQFVVEHIFEYNRGMELGDLTAMMCDPRRRLDEALDTIDTALTDLIGTVDTGGLDHPQLSRRSRCGSVSKPSATNSRSSITG